MMRRLRKITPCGLVLLGTMAGAAAQPAASVGHDARKELNTQAEVIEAMHRCWIPPQGAVRPGMEITVMLVIDRNGELFGEPRFTYMTPGVNTEIRAAYQRSVADMMARCLPLRFSDALGGAVAGRPLRLRLVDTRGQKRT
jgi:hypothetical protein